MISNSCRRFISADCTLFRLFENGSRRFLLRERNLTCHGAVAALQVAAGGCSSHRLRVRSSPHWYPTFQNTWVATVFFLHYFMSNSFLWPGCGSSAFVDESVEVVSVVPSPDGSLCLWTLRDTSDQVLMLKVASSHFDDLTVSDDEHHNHLCSELESVSWICVAGLRRSLGSIAGHKTWWCSSVF